MVFGVLVENFVFGLNVRCWVLSLNYLVIIMFVLMIIILFLGFLCIGEVKEIWEGDYIIYDNLKCLLYC